jgi:uncharacterized protein (UPF0332 family)
MATLLDVTRRLAKANPKRPAQPYLKRAISTAYYAMFEVLAKECANSFVGKKNCKAWYQVCRSLEHTFAKGQCNRAATLNFPQEIQAFAYSFVRLQEDRHKADYDHSSSFTRADVLVKIQEAEIAIQRLRTAPRFDRRAFAVWVMFKTRQK